MNRKTSRQYTIGRKTRVRFLSRSRSRIVIWTLAVVSLAWIWVGCAVEARADNELELLEPNFMGEGLSVGDESDYWDESRLPFAQSAMPNQSVPSQSVPGEYVPGYAVPIQRMPTQHMPMQPVPIEHMPIPNYEHQAAAAPEGCACGNGKHCYGVCKDPGHPEKPRRTLPGDRDLGDCPPMRYGMPDCERAGAPHCVAPWAKCSVTDKYSAWFAGGGAAFWKGRPRKSTEGTWGLDYNGLFGHANIWLDYTRCRNQGGEGAYQTYGGPEPFKFLHHE